MATRRIPVPKIEGSIPSLIILFLLFCFVLFWGGGGRATLRDETTSPTPRPEGVVEKYVREEATLDEWVRAKRTPRGRLELPTYRLTAGRATDCAIQELLLVPPLALSVVKRKNLVTPGPLPPSPPSLPRGAWRLGSPPPLRLPPFTPPRPEIKTIAFSGVRTHALRED